MREKTKIFQIGFSHCGTRTLHGYFKVNGIRSVHRDGGKLARRMFRNLEQGKELLTGYRHYQAFTDMEWLGPDRFLEGYKLYPQLVESYPDAIFILNTRDREAWIRSRMQYARGRYVMKHKAILGAGSDDEAAEYWRQDWDDHHRNVIEFFASKPYRFFVCKIETDLPHILSRMLPEFDFDPALYHILGSHNRAEVEAIMHRNHIARLRKQRGFLIALVASLLGVHFGLKSLRAFLQSLRAFLVHHITRTLKASERATQKQHTAHRHLKKMIQGFKGLNGDYVTHAEIQDKN